MMDVRVLAEKIAVAITSGEGTSSLLRLIRQFIMDLNQSDSPIMLFSEEPLSTGDARWDGMLAGVVEDFCFHHNISSPNWVFQPERFLDNWWFVTSIKSMRPTAIVETPAALSSRGVFLRRASLVNV
ncbi:MAG: hypothetical protein HKL80_01380 [Acidimicrobiales bacterium]|nr:hypothetical protein [Acidimicrobiales bacterium]